MRVSRILLVGLLTTTGCHWCHHKPPSAVTLEARPLQVLEVEDATETALLVQELGLVPLATAGRRVFFRAEGDLLQRLTALDYQVVDTDANDVLTRTMWVSGPSQEAPLHEVGLRILRREKDGWIVSGTLRRLSLLEKLGYRLEELNGREPHPRPILVVLEDRRDLSKVLAVGIDVYAMGPLGDRGFVVNGGAFEDAIDALRAQNFAVKIQVDPAEVTP
ncbi:MAG: hypothetical protein SF066_19955 [Thermoanaerobaculia bacterium]|nr:hypothetical protein [Thermoanaerobaculia bacterium]